MTKKKMFYGLLIVFLIFIGYLGIDWPMMDFSTDKEPPLPQYILLNQQQLITQAVNNMILVQGGRYKMGTDEDKYATGDNSPAHPVALHSFYMSKYLTSGQQLDSYYHLMDKSRKIADPRYIYDHNQYPATASWRIANQYCQWLGKKTGLSFSLPTEAQWEYAARDGGKDITYSTDNGQLDIGKNYPVEKNLNEGDVLLVTAYPVNELGIHQLGGNVSEWMGDWYDPDYYSESSVDNPTGPAQMDPIDIQQDGGGEKVRRGFSIFNYGKDDGQFQDMTNYARSSDVATGEIALSKEKYGFTYGFRCVINSDKPIPQLKENAQAQPKNSRAYSMHQ